ncbi:Gfo/Idh/MocA family oxidoreductase [Candidatus Omnitrophota bacterium]
MGMKIAVIGCGSWGRNIVRNFSELGVLGAVCDVDPANLKRTKDRFPSVSAVSSHKEILGDQSINAVAIASSAATHYGLTKDCLLAGKDVFVEKPLALTLEEGMELTALSEEANRILMVGHLLEYHPGILKLKELIDSGELGKIHYIYSSRLNLGTIRKEESILWCFAPHDISVMLLLLGEMPISVSSHGGNYLRKHIADVTVSTLEFASGVKGHIFVSWLHPYKEQKLIVVGDKKMAVFDDVASKGKLTLYNHKVEIKETVPVVINAPAETVGFDLAEPLKIECKHFIDSLKERNKPKTDGQNGVKVLKVLQACHRSLKKSGEETALEKNSFKEKNIYVHPSATIEVPVEIGDDTKIWHYAHIMKGAKVGRRCQIGQGVFVGSKAVIGNGVKLQNNVSVYDCVELEDDVFCGPSAVFTNVINPRSHISRKKEFKRTHVRQGATIGANATVICGVTIGRYAFIGAGSVVTKDVPPHALVYGNPARVQGWMCECGVKLEVKGGKGACGACGKEIAIKNREDGGNTVFARERSDRSNL